MKKVFESDSGDSMYIQYDMKSHKSDLFITKLSNTGDSLIDDVIRFIIDNGVQWIGVKLDKDPIVPENAVWYDEEGNKVYCHIVDFKRFYILNRASIVLTEDDGWTVVRGKQKSL